MAAALLYLPANRAFNSNGLGVPGATAELYLSGTSTPANFYSNSALSISLGATITANGAGRFDPAYQDESTAFRLIVKDASGVQLDDIDPFHFGALYGASVIGSGLTIAADRSAMAALATSVGTVQLSEAGREGTFVFDSSDLSAEVTDDTAQGIYVPPSTDSTGASGAWVRKLNGGAVTDYMFGAVDGADNADAIEAWADYVWANDVGSASCTSTGTISRGITLGQSSPTLRPKTGAILFSPKLTASAAMDYMVTLTRISYTHVDYGNCYLQGAATKNAPLASRLAKVGLYLYDIGRCEATGVVTVNSMYHHGVYVGSVIGNNNYGQIPFIQAEYCGSSKQAGGTSALTANWSAVALVGSNGSTSQTTTMTVDASPATDPAGMQKVAQIASYPYRISSIVGTTMTLGMPWLDNTSVTAGSGTLTYTFGAGLAIQGTDSSRCRVNGVAATRCGFAVLDQALYGAQINHIGTDANVDVFLGLGIGPDSTHSSTKLIGGYNEIATGDIQVIDFSATNTSKIEFGKLAGQGIDFTKWYHHAPRINSTSGLKQQAMPEFTVAGRERKIVIAQLGTDFTATYDPASIAAAGSTSTTVNVAVGGLLNGYMSAANPVQATFSNSLSGMILFASVTTVGSANNTITATFFNPTGSAVDLASGTLTVSFLK